jgi:hypothetical protein
MIARINRMTDGFREGGEKGWKMQLVRSLFILSASVSKQITNSWNDGSKQMKQKSADSD